MTSDDDSEPAVAGRTKRERAVVGAIVAVAALLLIVWLHGSRATAPPRLNGERTAALRVTCSGDGGRCSRAAELQLTVSNGGRFRHVFAVGIDDQYAIHWYAPRPPDVVSAVAPAGVDWPLGASVRLGVDHAAGKLRVYALFSDAPVSAQELSSATAELRQQARLPSALEALPLARTDVLQKSALVDVEP